VTNQCTDMLGLAGMRYWPSCALFDELCCRGTCLRGWHHGTDIDRPGLRHRVQRRRRMVWHSLCRAAGREAALGAPQPGHPGRPRSTHRVRNICTQPNVGKSGPNKGSEDCLFHQRVVSAGAHGLPVMAHSTGAASSWAPVTATTRCSSHGHVVVVAMNIA